MKLRRWLTRLYPRPWRYRYGEEFEALLDECLRSPLDVLDILLGALDAHLQLLNDLNWRLMNMVNKLRTTIWLVFAGYIVFVLGGLSLVGLVDDSPAVPLMKTDLPLQAAWTVIQFGAVISLLAVIIGGLPLAVTFIRRAYTTSRRDLRLLLVPIGAVLVFLLYILFMGALASGWIHIQGITQRVSPGNFPTGNKLLLGGLMLVFVLGAFSSVWAVWKILTNTEDEGTFAILGQNTTVRLYSFAFLPAVIATGCMLLMLAATILFGSLASTALPGWFAGHFGLLLSSTTFSFGITLTLMALATILAVFGIIRGWKVRKPSSY